MWLRNKLFQRRNTPLSERSAASAVVSIVRTERSRTWDFRQPRQYSIKGVVMGSKAVFDYDVVSWVVEEALGKHASPKMRELGMRTNQ